ncbi:hypothetical protein, partial [Jutongia sp.]|uniref:hypothetical protein n=1 Tax=Jutongia sp. TaxID=2944204 RepID=UPI0030799373
GLSKRNGKLVAEAAGRCYNRYTVLKVLYIDSFGRFAERVFLCNKKCRYTFYISKRCSMMIQEHLLFLLFGLGVI